MKSYQIAVCSRSSKRILSSIGNGMTRVVSISHRTERVARRTKSEDLTNLMKDRKRLTIDSYKIISYVK